MKKTFIKTFVLALGVAFAYSLSNGVNATSNTPCQLSGKNVVFANGTPITIEARDDNQAGAKVVWAGGSIIVPENATIFGGKHNSDEAVTSSIIIKGGKVANVFGGGMHKSNTTSAKITMQSGEVDYIMGGGAAYLITDCGGECTFPKNVEDSKKSDCKTGNVEINVTGGKVTNVLGGGESYSDTDNVSINISNGTITGAVMGSGSNGNTDNAKILVTGGNIATIQSANRGFLTSSDIKVYGGEVNEIILGTDDNTVTAAKIEGQISIEVGYDAKVNNIKKGKNGSADLSDDIYSAKILESAITGKSELPKEKVKNLYQVVIDDIVYNLEEGKQLKDIEGYDSITNRDGYTFKYFTDGIKNYDGNTIVNGHITLKTVFEKVEEKTTDKKDSTPKTGSVDTVLYASLICSVIALGGIYTVKKLVK